MPDGVLRFDDLVKTFGATRAPKGVPLAVAVALWFVLEHLPLARCLHAIGADPGAAALNGIPVERVTVLAFTASGVLTSVAGVPLASKLGIGRASVGLESLRPAPVGASLGSTTIRPGRVNVWGGVVGVVVLAVGVSGMQQVGGSFWVEPLFIGTALLVAIAIAGHAGRLRAALLDKPRVATTPMVTEEVR